MNIKKKVNNMNEEQKKLIKKLNEDNKTLLELHKSWIAYAKGMLVIGILAVLIFIIFQVIN